MIRVKVVLFGWMIALASSVCGAVLAAQPFDEAQANGFSAMALITGDPDWRQKCERPLDIRATPEFLEVAGGVRVGYAYDD